MSLPKDFKPTLAKEFSQYEDKIVYPCITQPKIDGIRCITVVKKGKATLYTRNNKEITSVPHINEQMSYFEDGIYDGELAGFYEENEPMAFEDICSYVKRKKPKTHNRCICYTLFDFVDESLCYNIRVHTLLEWLKEIQSKNGSTFVDRIAIIPTHMTYHEYNLKHYLEYYLGWGYEGVMIRRDAWEKEGYLMGRTNKLLKRKPVQHGFFTIIDAIEGKGKLKGKLGALVCKTPGGIQFRVKMAVPESELAKMWVDKSWVGQEVYLTCNEWTKKGVPRFPRGQRLIDPLQVDFVE